MVVDDDGTGRAQRARVHGGRYPRAFGVDLEGPLPTQFHAREDDDGVRRLCWALLEDAIACATGGNHLVVAHGRTERTVMLRRAREQAAAWIMSARRDYLFAFLNVCDILTVDPERIRAFVTAGRVFTPDRRGTNGRTRLGRAPLRLVVAA